MSEARSDRESWLARTFVELADTLVDDYDVVDFLSVLAGRCGELLGPAEVGVVVAGQDGSLRVVGSSSERLHVLELFEVQNEEGPCLDSYRTGEAILNAELTESRWPAFSPRARDAGFEVAHALPMRLRETVIGALNVFQSNGAALNPGDLELSRALADVATIGLLQQRALRRATVLAEQLESALKTRIVIEQAKGVLAERLGIGVEEAFARLRRHARDGNQRLAEVAAGLVSGTVQFPDHPS